MDPRDYMARLLETAWRVYSAHLRTLPDSEAALTVNTAADFLDDEQLRTIAGRWGRWVYLRAVTDDVSVIRNRKPASTDRGLLVRTADVEKDFWLRPGEKVGAVAGTDASTLVILWDSTTTWEPGLLKRLGIGSRDA